MEDDITVTLKAVKGDELFLYFVVGLEEESSLAVDDDD